jgi:hypothetical protein
MVFEDGDEIFGANSFSYAYAYGNRIALVAIRRKSGSIQFVIPTSWPWAAPFNDEHVESEVRSKILARLKEYAKVKGLKAQVIETDENLEDLIPL